MGGSASETPGAAFVGAPVQVPISTGVPDLTGLRWLRKALQSRERRAHLGLGSWAGGGIVQTKISTAKSGTSPKVPVSGWELMP
jgi:hypothetical protein